jgi:outer membrane protein assembly factor BamB
MNWPGKIPGTNGRSRFMPRPLIYLLLWLGALPAWGDWPEYRGPWANGHAAAPGDQQPVGLPLAWSEHEHVTWKTPIPERGWSTPVVLGKQIWLTTATEDGRDFFAICVNVDTGRILFNEKLFHCDTPEILGNSVNCYASPSPVIEPGRVFVHFGSYGTACLDTKDFQVLWKRDDLPCHHFRGPGSSLVGFQDLLILTMDGIDVQYLVALDQRTGRTVWKTDRTAEWNDLLPDGQPARAGDMRKAFCTPVFIEAAGRMQMISVGSKAAYAYDPANGRELWQLKTEGHSVASRPLFGHGLVFLATGSGKSEFLALRPDGRGLLPDTNVVWRTTRGAPKMASPLLVDDLLFLLAENGVMRCLEATTGHEFWQERIGGEYYASPLFADGHIYCFSQDGKTTVLKAGRKFEVVATSTLEDGFMASPAVTGRALILRTKKGLYRIETAGPTGAGGEK